MKTLDRYVAREMLVPFVAGFSIMLVVLVGNMMYNKIDLITGKLQQWPLAVYYVLLQTPTFAMLALPAGALFGCSLAISRLARDSETTMMRMAGISARRIFLPIFVVGAITSGAAYLFQEKVTVWAQQESVKVLQRLWLAPGPPPVEANVVFRAQDYYFYVGSVTHRGSKLELGDVMMYELPVTQGFATLTTAKTAVEENHVWWLKDGTTWRLNRQGDPELVAHFTSLKLDLRQSLANYFVNQEIPPQALTILQLREKVRTLGKSGLNLKQYQLELSYQSAIPLSSLVLLFCVAPLSLKFGRSGSFMGVLIGISVYALYWNVIVFSRAFADIGYLPPVLAGWSEVIIFTALGAFLMWKVE